jgi:hypothetical protein
MRSVSRNLIRQSFHHRQIPIRRKDTRLDKALFADHFEVKLESQTAGQLARELSLCPSVSLAEWMDPIYLG